MSLFVKKHVTRIFKDAGYDLLEIYGDRGGIVQGDGLHLTVTPDIASAARRFSADPEVHSNIESDAAASQRFRLELYGGSVSPGLEGVWLPSEFVNFMKDECSEIYYRAQREVNAIFEAEDAPDREWDGEAYVGVVDEFPIEISPECRLYVRVSRVADQSFNAYESGDEEADRADAAAIVEGKYSHGTVKVELFEIDADEFIDGVEVYHPFTVERYDGRDFESGTAEREFWDSAQMWVRDGSDAHTLELAADIISEAGEHQVAEALLARGIARGLHADNAEAESAASFKI